MRVSQEDSTVKKTHAAMKTPFAVGAVATPTGRGTSYCGATCQAAVPATTCGASSRLSRECRSAIGSAPIATITSPTCGRHSRRRTALRHKPCSRDTSHDAILAVLLHLAVAACALHLCQQNTAMLAPGVLLVCFTVKNVLLVDK